MRTVMRIVLACSLFPVMLFAQSTFWQTTHGFFSNGNCRLQSNSFRIIVNPVHADVEEEASIVTEGTVWDGDSATLEIVGTFTLSPGSSLRSMLLWNGSTILKARLKSRARADKEYEDVVDRDAVQYVSRDPAIIEYLGNNQYRYRIYPVSIKGTRKIRILYTVPVSTGGESPRFVIQPAFSLGCSWTPENIDLEFVKSHASSDTYLMAAGSMKKMLTFNAMYQLPYGEVFANGWYGDSLTSALTVRNAITIIMQKKDPRTGNTAYSKRLTNKGFEGHYTAIVTPVPQAIRDSMTTLAAWRYSLDAIITNDGKPWITRAQSNGTLNIFMKSATAWDKKVEWVAYNNDGDVLARYNQTFAIDTAASAGSIVPLLWAAQYSLTQDKGSLGGLFGFVDRKMTLLALERDALDKKEAALYAESGVPLLKQSEIFLDSADIPLAPLRNTIIEFVPQPTAVIISPEMLLRNMKCMILADGTIQITFGAVSAGTVKAILFDLSGRAVKVWDSVPFANGSAALQAPAQCKGTFVLKVEIGNQRISQKIVLK